MTVRMIQPFFWKALMHTGSKTCPGQLKSSIISSKYTPQADTQRGPVFSWQNLTSNYIQILFRLISTILQIVIWMLLIDSQNPYMCREPCLPLGICISRPTATPRRWAITTLFQRKIRTLCMPWAPWYRRPGFFTWKKGCGRRCLF